MMCYEVMGVKCGLLSQHIVAAIHFNHHSAVQITVVKVNFFG